MEQKAAFTVGIHTSHLDFRRTSRSRQQGEEVNGLVHDLNTSRSGLKPATSLNISKYPTHNGWIRVLSTYWNTENDDLI
uniref:Uncharacterized protein n=1 Tax=Parascaris univalens TaxID=6257 RepID=A0A915A3V4_PARUN